MRLEKEFFDREIHEVARDLLGCDLTRQVGGQKRVGRIWEVEVYEGANDLASHARSGVPTKRTGPMFGEPGTIYVYTIYGRYQCLNFRAPPKVGPGAILIRGCSPEVGQAQMAADRGLISSAEEYHQGLDSKLMSGPAKICQALSVGTKMSGALVGRELHLTRGEQVWREAPEKVIAGPRIGLNPKTCGESAWFEWRYLVHQDQR